MLQGGAYNAPSEWGHIKDKYDRDPASKYTYLESCEDFGIKPSFSQKLYFDNAIECLADN